MPDIDNGSLVLQPVRTGSVRARVRDTLRDAILSGQLRPGDAIREAHMAKTLQVSQPTIREALIELEHAGLVVRNPQRDTTVTRLTGDDIRERARLRVLLETEAAVEAARRIGEDGVGELRTRLDDIHQALGRDSYHDFAAADLDFHRAIWRLSGNRTLFKMLELITVPLFAFLSIRRSRVLKDLVRVVHSHDPILAAIEARDADRIHEAFRQHIAGSYDQFVTE